jgi:hypothetical protein
MRGVLKVFFILIAGPLFLFTACSKNNAEADTSTAVPNVTVNVSININSPDFSALTNVGGVAYINNVGYRGIILYRLASNMITAFDRTCTYDLPNTGGVVYALSGSAAECADCNSIYNLGDGSVNTGPTTLGLKEYKTFFNTSTGILTITN